MDNIFTSDFQKIKNYIDTLSVKDTNKIVDILVKTINKNDKVLTEEIKNMRESTEYKKYILELFEQFEYCMERSNLLSSFNEFESDSIIGRFDNIDKSENKENFIESFIILNK